VFVAAAVGFVWFLSQLRGVEMKPGSNADGIVVLTAARRASPTRWNCWPAAMASAC